MWIKAQFSHKCKNHQIAWYICNFPDSKIVVLKESLSNSKPSTDSKSPKTMKVLFPEETVFGSKQVTPEISLRETTGTAATTCTCFVLIFTPRQKFYIMKEYLLYMITLGKYLIKKHYHVQ